MNWYFSYEQWPMVTLIVLAAVFYGILLYRQLLKEKDFTAGLAVFFIALLPRLAMGLWLEYIPASDFSNYYQLGLAFHAGDFQRIADIAQGYGIPSFTGLSVLNGLIASLTQTVRGFQTVQAVITSVIALLIFCLGKQVDRKVGLIAGLLWAFYPSNIVFTQVTTNQHWSTMIGLLAALCILRAVRETTWGRSLLFAALSGILMGIGQFAHPSTPPVVVAYSAFLLGKIVVCLKEKKKDALRFAGLLAAFLVMAMAVDKIGYASLQKVGAYHPDAYSRGTIYGKLLMGTNPETVGGISYEDLEELYAHPQEEYLSHTVSVLVERVKDVPTFVKTMTKKAIIMWCAKDGSFDCYIHGLYIYGLDRAYGNEPFDLKGLSYQGLHDFIKEFAFVDFIYVFLIYLSASLGILLKKDQRNTEPYCLSVWILLGWIAVHQLVEQQARYRNYAMPYLLILAAMGVVWLINWTKNRAARKNTDKEMSEGEVESPEPCQPQ